MTEKEIEGLKEVFEGIFTRHDGDDRRAVASMLIDLVVESYDDTEGRIIQ